MRNHRKGFTLVEILIVTLLLSIIAMLVVPKFISASDEARESVLGTDIQTLRRQILLYRAEHGGQGPHLNDSGAMDTNGFIERMTGRTDPSGDINPAGTCGPYLLKWPANPFCQEAVAAEVIFGILSIPPRNGTAGWYYNTNTCLISANSTRGGEAFDPPEDRGESRGP